MQQEYRESVQLPFRPARDRRLIANVLAGLPVFRHLSSTACATLADHATLREARRAEVIAQRGEQMPGLFALASGLAKLSLRGARGREDVVRLLGAGDSFGLAAALLDRPCPVDMVALAPCLVVTVPPAPLQRLLECDAAFARQATRALAERLLGLLGDLETSLQHNGLQRLAHYLDAHAQAERVWLPATKTTIAALLGVKKETLSRMLHALAATGVVQVAGREVAILDRLALQRVAGLAP